MKQYPTIDKTIMNIPVWVWDKLDGSNIRVEWTRKNGLAKFGSRHQLIDNSHLLRESIVLIKEYENDLNVIFKRMRVPKITMFWEFFGERSFAGNHFEEPHKVVLLDVFVYKQGCMQSNNFYKMFNSIIPIPNLLHHGYVRSDLEQAIRKNEMFDITFEGVVCKGAVKKNMGFPRMFKIKTNAWLEKLKNYCANDDKMFNRLA